MSDPVEHPVVPVTIQVHPKSVIAFCEGVDDWTCVRADNVSGVSGSGFTIEQALNDLEMGEYLELRDKVKIACEILKMQGLEVPRQPPQSNPT